MPYGAPLRRVDDFAERYRRMRNPDTFGGSRVVRVEEPYANGRPGDVLAYRNMAGTPTGAITGNQGGDIVGLAAGELAETQRAPETTYFAQDTPQGTVYAKRPFEALTGRTNYTPYGTISSRPETEEERVAREWENYVVRGNPVSEVPAIVDNTPVLQQQQAQGFQNRRALMTEGTPERDAWVEQENNRREAEGLGPLETAYEDFVADKAFEQDRADLSRDIYNAARRAERIARTETGRRTRSGELVPTRTSSISPSFSKRLQGQSRNLARMILSGGDPDAITRGWQDLTQSAAAGAPVGRSQEQLLRDQAAAEDRERLNLTRQGNIRSQTQFEQEQADRLASERGMVELLNAKTPEEQQQVIRKYPQILGTRAGQNMINASSPNRVDYGTYRTALNRLNEKEKDGTALTSDEEAERQFLTGAINRFVQDENRRLGIQTPSATVTVPQPKSNLPEGKIIVQNGQRFRVTNGTPVPIK